MHPGSRVLLVLALCGVACRDAADPTLTALAALSAASPGACAIPQARPFSQKFDLSAWLASHSRPTATTTQSGQAEPAPFAGTDFRAEVAKFRAAWQQMIGPIPESCAPLDPRTEPLGLTAEEQARVAGEGYTLSRVSYRGAHGERIPALLHVPSGRTGRLPAVLVMHQSLAVCGKKEPAGVCLSGSDNLAFARDLARAGLVTLAPDSIGYGDRGHAFNDTGSEYADAAPLLSRFPQATLMGLRISDVRRAIDFLQSRPEVDPARIGMVGHSNGGIETLFSAAFEPRIRCAVSNAGPNLVRRETLGFAGLAPGVARWAAFGYMPAFGFYDGDRAALPVETHQLYAMIAPRGLFVAFMEDDSVAPAYDRIDFAAAQARRAYAALGGDFQWDKVASGLTDECRQGWAVPSCLTFGRATCLSANDSGCLARYVTAGLTQTCIADAGATINCADRVYRARCPQPTADAGAACLRPIGAMGVDVSQPCLDDGFTKGCRRDHGFYPQTRNRAFPWLTGCLGATGGP